MKIGILTFHFAHNSGAVLQTYALQKTLQNLGHEVYVIDYIPEQMERNQYKKYKIIPNNKNLSLSMKIRITIRLIINFFILSNRIDDYKKFIIKNLNLTKRIKKEELGELNFDAYILGSDQIWNEGSYGFQDIYFGAFADKNKSKIVSYAASLGGNKIDDEKEFERLLKNLDYISVREEQSVDFVKEYVNKDVVDTLDPTLLINSKKWIKDFSLNNRKNDNLLIISLVRKNDDITMKYIKKLAKENKLNIVSLVDFKEIKKGKKIINNPYTFLDLIKNSRYIVTDSFHGVVFSIIFRKEFFVIKREAEKIGKANCSFRIENLLGKLQIKGRFIGDEIQEINYDKVEKILEEERKKSINFLVESLRED